MKFYVTSQLGAKRHLTPEGFLVCEEVPICRIGTLRYGPGETPIEVGADGIAYVERDPDEVFAPNTIASAAGKSVVNDHPEEDVDPDNWNDLSVGVVLDPRRGTGVLDDFIVADLLITNRQAIEDVEAGKREVSCGYDAKYEQISPGRGRQSNIIINHVALVESGRCGVVCAIGDANTVERKSRLMTIKDRILNAFKNKNEGALTAVLDELPAEAVATGDKSTVININSAPVATRDSRSCDAEEEEEEKKKKEEKAKDAASVRDSVFSDKRFTDLAATVDKIAKAVVKDKEDEDEDEEEEKKKTGDEKKLVFEAEAPAGTGDEVHKAKDSAYFEESFQETVALAEIILPGVSVPTFDSKAKPETTVKRMCDFRRRVLDQAYTTQPETRDFMDETLRGKTLDSLGCMRVRDVFMSTGAFRKRSNNSAGLTARTADQTRNDAPKGITTLADLNKKNAEFYKS